MKKTNHATKCAKCGNARFATAKKTQGKRTLIKCRKCGQLHGCCG